MTVFRALSALAFLTACSGAASVGTPDAGAQLVTIGVKGTVSGGQQPVAGAKVQLYAANTLSGTASIALASATTTGTAGDFAFTGVSCPGNALFYVLATGGIAAGATANPNLALMTTLGSCGIWNSNTPVVVNELTTVAATSVLSHFMISPTGLSGDPASLSAAFDASQQLVIPGFGSSPGTGLPQGQSVPTSLINTLGNIVSACVASGGGSAGDVPQSACGLLFSATTPDATRLPSNPIVPNNTINALINIANNPVLRVPTLFSLLPASGPFKPQLAAVPASLQIQVSSTNGLLISHGDLNFQQTAVGTTAGDIEQVSFTNGSAAAVTLNTVVLGGNQPESFAVTNNTCTATLAAGASCTVTLTFTPRAAGFSSAVLTAQTSTGDLSVNLFGFGQ